MLVGLASLIETMGFWFDWVRIAGAAYLVWLGIKLLCRPAPSAIRTQTKRPRIGFFWQGFLVLMSNPKALLVFGAFIPQFVDAKGDYVGQVILLGVTAMVVAGIFDSRLCDARRPRTPRAVTAARASWCRALSGGFLIGGGVWLALVDSAK